MRKSFTKQFFSIIMNELKVGGIAQLGERLNGIQEVCGSIPHISTKKHLKRSVSGAFFVLCRRLLYGAEGENGPGTASTGALSVGTEGVGSGKELIVNAEGKDKQHNQGKKVGEVYPHPIVHFQSVAGVCLCLKVFPAPAVPGDAE